MRLDNETRYRDPEDFRILLKEAEFLSLVEELRRLDPYTVDIPLPTLSSFIKRIVSFKERVYRKP